MLFLVSLLLGPYLSLILSSTVPSASSEFHSFPRALSTLRFLFYRTKGWAFLGSLQQDWISKQSWPTLNLKAGKLQCARLLGSNRLRRRDLVWASRRVLRCSCCSRQQQQTLTLATGSSSAPQLEDPMAFASQFDGRLLPYLFLERHEIFPNLSKRRMAFMLILFYFFPLKRWTARLTTWSRVEKCLVEGLEGSLYQ